MQRIYRLAVVGLLWLTPLAQAADSSPACPSGPLRVGFYEYGLAYRAGRGYDVDLIRELARRLHCPIASESVFPWIRTLKMLQIGEVDIATSATPTPDRLQYAWIYTYKHSKSMVLLRTEVQARTLAALPDDPKLRWGVIRGWKFSPMQDQLLADLAKRNKIVPAVDEDDLYKMLADGVITGALAHPTSYDDWLRNPRIRNQVVVLDLFPDVEATAGGVALSKKRFPEASAELWHAELKKMSRDGTLRDIFRRFLSEETADYLLRSPVP
ncbi:transporter substrate-binding domain-containing protein [Chromobacterium subtsugae]|uniref:Transporter substrate-binding domain-containing protein n=1 Tax=Chromobacterium subtsugae TaxID=251747 RepID=A0ABS7FJW2_9NEIS|nr:MULTISPECIES: transporter substrate-binding domain-containing protein [Chromobacterium]MBW7565540.1 transporter substrate-binding domain-containing protein [Chromobacterium subtsugae]MBW8290376.1 transporter substrate-binding domain-containing protein [Chromobacterium subtsugae]